MNAEQRKRFEKLHTDEFYLLQVSREPAAAFPDDGAAKQIMFRVGIVGSTKNVYEALLYTDRSFFCNCPDGKTHAKRHGVQCKHVCFLVQRVLRLDFVRDVYNTKFHVADDKWEGTVAKLERLARGEVDRAVTHDALTARWRETKGEPAACGAGAAACGAGVATCGAGVATCGVGTAGTSDADLWAPHLAALDKLAEDDVCAICYAEFVPAHPATIVMANELQSCAKCKGYVHTKCMDKWISMGRPTCVNCNQAFHPVAVGPPSLVKQYPKAGAKPSGKRKAGAGAGRGAKRYKGDAEYVNLG